jgi:hypothetical protein
MQHGRDKAAFSEGIRRFRPTPRNGHRRTDPVGPVRATNGRRTADCMIPVPQVSGTKSYSPTPCSTRNTADVSPALVTRCGRFGGTEKVWPRDSPRLIAGGVSKGGIRDAERKLPVVPRAFEWFVAGRQPLLRIGWVIVRPKAP